MSLFKIEWDENRVFGLDLLRAFAILIVVIGHGISLLPEKIQFFYPFINWDGVTIFFVLSGFLIGGILIKHLEKKGATRKGLFNFWIRRWFRTIPLYFLVLTFLVLLQIFFASTTDIPVWKYYLFIQNLSSPHPGFFGPAWSLSVEEWFYLTIPIIIFLSVYFLKQKTRNAVLFTAIFVVVFITLIRYYRFSSMEIASLRQWDNFFRSQVITRLDSIMYGVIGAYLFSYKKQFWEKIRFVGLVAGLLIFIGTSVYHFIFEISYQGLFFSVFFFPLYSFATFLLLPFLSSYKLKRGNLYKPITYISLISYSMYLLHYSLILRWIVEGINWEVYIGDYYLIMILKNLLYWGLTISFSILVYKYFEVPMTKLRDLKIFKTYKIYPVVAKENK